MTFLKRTKASVCAAALAAGLCLAAPGTASAQQTWDFTGFVYLWGAAIGGTTTTG